MLSILPGGLEAESRMMGRKKFVALVVAASLALPGGLCLPPAVVAAVTAEQVRQAIERGCEFLLRQQRADGSWPEISTNFRGGTTALVMLALLESGVPAQHPQLQAGLRFLRTIEPALADSGASQGRTYVVALQTMVYCAAEPEKDKGNIIANVLWLERAQLREAGSSGKWTYGLARFGGRGDNSNTQYALLGLRAAAESGIPVDPPVWQRSRDHFLRTQHPDGSWGYSSAGGKSTGSMTVAGISSLIICGLSLHQSKERLKGGKVVNCGEWGQTEPIMRAIQWLGKFDEQEFVTNPRDGQWTYYYLYGLERAARLTGQRFIGRHDWYRAGAEWLVKSQAVPGGYWRGNGLESNELIATSFALLFLAKGRRPVLINKLRHDAVRAERPDWNNDPDDVRNLTEFVSRNWRRAMTWQVVDAKVASVEDLLQAPILFFNGHMRPEFTAEEKRKLREYVEQGGFIVAEACCASRAFDAEVRNLFKELFPDRPLRQLGPEHPIWKAEYVIPPDNSLEGIDVGCCTSVIYSRRDLSCLWNLWRGEAGGGNQVAILRALRLGSNIVAYCTGKEMLPDKLAARKVVRLASAKPDARWMLQLAILKHGGDWNVAPLAVPNLMASLRDSFQIEAALSAKELTPLDENLCRYPLLFMQGRGQFSFDEEQIAALRGYLKRGGTLFANACCGREPFDTAFRAMIKQMFPDKGLERIPVDDPLFGNAGPDGEAIGFPLKTVQYTRAMPQQEGEPYLEGVKLEGRWAVIYSRYDISCALQRHQSADCRGYRHESALKLAANAILYAMQH